MIEEKIFARFPRTSQETLSQLSRLLYAEQIRTWAMLHTGVAALKNVRTRTVDCGKFSVRLQFNPQRIISSGAKVDDAAIKARRCFLCTENLPPEQQGVLYQDMFLILCNPMPIFNEHFTITHRDHIPQAIEGSLLPFLDLAKDLSGSHTVFYNGPRCGASAPDHLHFQASPRNFIPVETEAAHPERRKFIRRISSVDIITLSDVGRTVIVLESTEREEMEECFRNLLRSMRAELKTEEEPMINALCSYDGGSWRIILFPRSKHRPDIYFLEGERKVLVSPAAVDIGGVIVTPVEKDFTRLDAAQIIRIYDEVSLSHETTDHILQRMKP